MSLIMKSVFNQYLVSTLFCAVLSAQNIGAYLGINPSALITSKSDNAGSTLSYTTFYSFDQNNDITKYKRFLSSFSIKEPRDISTRSSKKIDKFDFIIAYTAGEEDNYTYSYGLNYNLVKKKIGFSFNGIKHDMTVNGVDLYKPMEFGTSIHFRLRKKQIKPYFHYSYTDFKNDMDPKETLIFGAVSRINNISVGTHVVSFLDKLEEGGENFSYIAVSIGFIFD